MAGRGARQISLGLQVKFLHRPEELLHSRACAQIGRFPDLQRLNSPVHRYNCLFITCTYTLPLLIMGVCYTRMARWHKDSMMILIMTRFLWDPGFPEVRSKGPTQFQLMLSIWGYLWMQHRWAKRKPKPLVGKGFKRLFVLGPFPKQWTSPTPSQ